MFRDAEPRQPAEMCTPPMQRRALWGNAAAAIEPGRDLAASLSPQPFLIELGATEKNLVAASDRNTLSCCMLPWPWLRDGWTVLHLGISGVLFWFGALLIFPVQIWVLNVAYGHFDSLAPGWAWSLLLGIGACVGVWGVVTKRPVGRHVSCATLSLLHTLIALCFIFIDPLSLSGVTYSILAVLALLPLVAGR